MTDYAKQLAQAKPTVTITPSPLIFEKVNEKWRGLYLGQKHFDKADTTTGEIKSIPVAHFFDGKKVLFNMGAQLTRTLQDVPIGVSVEIELTELKANKHGGGKTKIYAVTPLDIPRMDLAEMFGGYLNIQPPAAEHLIGGAPSPAQIEAPSEEKPDNVDGFFDADKRAKMSAMRDALFNGE